MNNTNCQDKRCQQRVEDTHEEVFAKGTGLKDRARCLEKKKIPWSALIWLVPLTITVFGMASTMIWRSVNAGEEAQDKVIQANKEQCQEVQQDVKRIDAVQHGVTTTIDKTLPTIDKRQEKMDQTISDIAKAVARIEAKLEEQ